MLCYFPLILLKCLHYNYCDAKLSLSLPRQIGLASSILLTNSPPAPLLLLRHLVNYNSSE